MRAIGGVGNGLFETVQDLVGYMDLCYIKGDDEELFEDIFKAMGDVQYRIWERFMEEFSDVFCVLRFGDDLGFNTMTLISTDDIRKNIIPQYRRITDKVHAMGKPFLLHSCGNLFAVFDELIDGAKSMPSIRMRTASRISVHGWNGMEIASEILAGLTRMFSAAIRRLISRTTFWTVWIRFKSGVVLRSAPEIPSLIMCRQRAIWR